LSADLKSTETLRLLSYIDAKQQKLSRFFTGIPCVRGHTAERFVASKACVVCARANQNKWNSDNRPKLKQYDLKYYQNNSETRREAARSYRRNNPEAANKATREYRKRNPALIAAHCSGRRASILNATPKWADLQVIKQFYFECRKISKQTGIVHQVDHIIPLKNKYVCGLHVPCNLQIITATENRRKKNLYEPG
jgi:cytochrome c553